MNGDALRSVRNPAALRFGRDAELRPRIARLEELFQERYGAYPELCVVSPGRAEIIGNHTDYNRGLAIACAIERTVVAVFRRRPDRRMEAFSTSYPDDPRSIDLDTLAPGSTGWGAYLEGVAAELIGAGDPVPGVSLLLDTTVPETGGVSSSAAFELAVAIGLGELAGAPRPPIEAAILARRAENGPFVGSPCGFLDQGAVALSTPGGMVLFDFDAGDDRGIGITRLPGSIGEAGLRFVLALDPTVKRNLGASGYPARRRSCEQSLPILSELLGSPVRSLREVTPPRFEAVCAELELRGGAEMRMRVEHVVYENHRVELAARALRTADFRRFGELLTESGASALELYELDDGTPELTLLVEEAQRIPGVWGSRNMGGGFSAVILALVEDQREREFRKTLEEQYRAAFGRGLDFLSFTPAGPAEIL